MKEDILRVVQEFFISGSMLVGINSRTIVLILKVKNPQSIQDFMPVYAMLCTKLF